LDVSASDLNARYGRTTSRRRRNLVFAIVFGGAILVVFAAWAIWVGLFQPTASITFDSTGQSRVSSKELKVNWQVSVNPGTVTECAIQALDKNFGIVGWKIVMLPASALSSRQVSTVVRTAQPAVSGNAYQCWIPGQVDSGVSTVLN
jgi:Domain of unknown function (DUF4307)